MRQIKSVPRDVVVNSADALIDPFSDLDTTETSASDSSSDGGADLTPNAGADPGAGSIIPQFNNSDGRKLTGILTDSTTGSVSATPDHDVLSLQLSTVQAPDWLTTSFPETSQDLNQSNPIGSDIGFNAAETGDGPSAVQGALGGDDATSAPVNACATLSGTSQRSGTSQQTGTAGSATSGGTSGIVSGGSQQSGLVINVSYDASCNNAPAGFKTAVAAVVSYYESQFTNPITISIDVGYGEVDGESVGGLSESLYYLNSLTYSQLKTALVANATSAADETAISTLPATDPTNGGTYWLSQANEKALGLLGGSSLDGYIGVNSSVNWDYSTTNTTTSVPAGEYDLFSSVAHEISEVMGRELQVGGDVGGTTAYSPLDLFHYSAPGVRDFSGTTAGYFSINGGVTDLNTFNTNPGGDFGDWAGSTANSYNAYGSAGVVEPVSTADLTLLNVIGYDAATSGTGPQVSSVSATAGDYNVGKALTLTLNMSEVVNVIGTPTLTLNDGGIATYVSGTGTSALTFTYTVGAGQNTAGLAVMGLTGTIADLAGNALSTANLPETFAGVKVDTTPPVVSTVSATAGDYNVGKALTLTLNMSEAVNVIGTPTLTLNDGGIATYVSGTGTSALTFSYTVGAGQNTAGLAVMGLTGTIADLAGNALSTATLPETFAGVIVDTTPPVVSTVSATAGDYDVGKALTLTLNMSEAVNVTGTPTLTLNDGGSATYTGGTGTSALTFSYTVGAGQNTAGLAVMGLTGTIADLAGNALSTANLPETFAGVKVDTATPVVSTVSATAGDYDVGKALTLTLNMSEAVNVTGTPTLTLNDGGSATYVSGTGTSALTFSYTVGAGQNTAGLAVMGLTGTIADLAGNALSTATLPETFAGVIVGTAPPVVSTVSATAGDYDAGKALTLTLNMSEAVNVTGTPTLTLNDGGSATYTGGTGTNALTFSYTVGAGQNTSGLAVMGLTGTIADLAGNALSTANLPETFAGVKVDTATPVVSTVSATAGDYDVGKALTLTLNMSEAVNVTGTPTLTLNDGGSATYASGTGTSALTFSYTVGAGQNTAGLAVMGLTGTIADLAGNALSTANLPETFAGVKVDTAPSGRIDGVRHRGRLRCRQGAHADAQHERGGQRYRHPDADAQRRRQRHLCFGHRHEHADFQLHGGGGPEHRRPGGDGAHRHHRRPGRQRAEHRQPAGDLRGR